MISRISSAAVVGVHRRVERRQLVADRQLVAVLLDQRGDVVALERHGEPGNGPVTELHDEKVSVSWYTAIASS